MTFKKRVLGRGPAKRVSLNITSGSSPEEAKEFMAEEAKMGGVWRRSVAEVIEHYRSICGEAFELHGVPKPWPPGYLESREWPGDKRGDVALAGNLWGLCGVVQIKIEEGNAETAARLAMTCGEVYAYLVVNLNEHHNKARKARVRWAGSLPKMRQRGLQLAIEHWHKADRDEGISAERLWDYLDAEKRWAFEDEGIQLELDSSGALIVRNLDTDERAEPITLGKSDDRYANIRKRLHEARKATE